MPNKRKAPSLLLKPKKEAPWYEKIKEGIKSLSKKKAGKGMKYHHGGKVEGTGKFRRQHD